MSIGDTCIDYWDFYFVLTMMPEYGEWVHVDVTEGTRDYDVLKMMHGASHIYIAEEEPGFISRITVAPMGQKWMQRLGKLFTGHEEEGKEIIKNLTEDWGLLNKQNDRKKKTKSAL